MFPDDLFRVYCENPYADNLDELYKNIKACNDHVHGIRLFVLGAKSLAMAFIEANLAFIGLAGILKPILMDISIFPSLAIPVLIGRKVYFNLK